MSVMNESDYVRKELTGREAAEFLLAVALDADAVPARMFALQSRATADLLRSLAAYLSFDAFAPAAPEPRVIAMRFANLLHQWATSNGSTDIDVVGQRERMRKLAIK